MGMRRESNQPPLRHCLRIRAIALHRTASLDGIDSLTRHIIPSLPPARSPLRYGNVPVIIAIGSLQICISSRGSRSTKAQKPQ